MFLRLLVAVLGAALITGTILLGMSEFTAMFRQRNGERYFLITDILPRPDPGRPERPPAAALPPERTGVDYLPNELGIEVEAPTEPAIDLSIERAAARPTLETAPTASE